MTILADPLTASGAHADRAHGYYRRLLRLIGQTVYATKPDEQRAKC